MFFFPPYTCTYKYIYLPPRSGIGSFESDKGQAFFLLYTKSQITNPRPHTFYTVLLNFILYWKK